MEITTSVKAIPVKPWEQKPSWNGELGVGRGGGRYVFCAEGQGNSVVEREKL